MPNKEKGEIGFDYEGKHYNLKFDFNAFCELEDLLDKPIDQILIDFQTGNKMGFREIRKFFLAGIGRELESKQPVEDKLEIVGGIIEGIGGLPKAQALILEGITAAFPDKKEGSTKKQKAADGNGQG